MSVTSESDEKMMPKNGKDSTAVDDADSRGGVGGNGRFNKGPWTTVEDAILVEYVIKHGEGNWNAVQKHSGLARCGKSCRLRWANHLRPDLKKGAFSPEEEHLIIQLHAKMGNKWARMAAEVHSLAPLSQLLPGRTDNELKNYWNTRIKRRQRAGLPIYQPDICLQVSNENQQKDDMSTCSSGDVHYPNFMRVNNFKIPAVEFKTLELNQQVYPPAFLDIPRSSLLDIPASSLLAQGRYSTHPKESLLPTVHPSKHLRGSGSLLPGISATISNAIPGGSQYQNDSYVQYAQSCTYFSGYDHNLTSNHASSSSVLAGRHAVLNGNPSSSEPNWAMKLELPSIQNQANIWDLPSSLLSSLDSVDTMIQTPPTEHALSLQNSGLLDAVLHESQNIQGLKNSSHQQNSQASDMVVNVMDTSSQWEPYEQLTPPLGHSSSFNVGSPVSGSSFDDPSSVQAIPGFRVKEEATAWDPMQYDNKVETTNQMFSRPGLLLASDYPKKDYTKNSSVLKDVIGTLPVDDLSRDCKQMDTSANFKSRPCA